MPKLYRPFAVATLALAAALAAQTATAQSAEAARAAVRKALQQQPEVLAKLNAYLAKTEAVGIARAGWMPRVDLNASAGTDRLKDKGLATSSVNSAGIGLVVSQVLWDGLSTRNAVEQAGHERMSRWFEFVDATEQTALESVRAVYDVQRQRKLVALAEDNLAQHRQAAAKIDQRFKAGVGRGVDLDQAQARVALAESNLETERANLHDVAARYQRIVGETPTAEVGELEVLRQGLPASASEAVATALKHSPLIAAGIENLRASRAAAAGRRSALQPTVEARARVGGGKNYSGVSGRESDGALELVMNWNLFNGGADEAAVREQQRLVSQAMDLRDKTCRDVRQNASVAFNEAEKLQLQLRVLARNAASIERARDAYRQQFDIGQRSLLDLLNAENEAYTARRALTNAAFDRAVAHARTLAAMSQLTTQLEIARNLLPEEGAKWSAGEDGPARCPAEAVTLSSLRTDGDGRAQAILDGSQATVAAVSAAPQPLPAARYTHASLSADEAAPTVQARLPVRSEAPPAAQPQPQRQALSTDGSWMHPAGNAPMPVRPIPVPPGMRTVATAAAVATPAGWVDASRSAGAADAATEVASLVAQWADAWVRRDLGRFAGLYAAGYSGGERTSARWMARLRDEMSTAAPLERQVDGLVAQPMSEGEVLTRFRQIDRTNGEQRLAERLQVWRQVNGQWRIARETTL